MAGSRFASAHWGQTICPLEKDASRADFSCHGRGSGWRRRRVRRRKPRFSMFGFRSQASPPPTAHNLPFEGDAATRQHATWHVLAASPLSSADQPLCWLSSQGPLPLPLRAWPVGAMRCDCASFRRPSLLRGPPSPERQPPRKAARLVRHTRRTARAGSRAPITAAAPNGARSSARGATSTECFRRPRPQSSSSVMFFSTGGATSCVRYGQMRAFIVSKRS